MNKSTKYILKALRKVYAKIFQPKVLLKSRCEQDPDKASQLIYDALMDIKPCMIARFGSTELTCLMNYIGVKQQRNQILNYISGKTNQWWWNINIINQMQRYAGFFPPTIQKVEQFCELLLDDIPDVDILGSWLTFEDRVISQDLKRIRLLILDPYWSTTPWTKALKGKKVLVIHPFAELIEKQYEKRELLFESDILPEFELKTIKAVQSVAGEPTEFNDWFEALDSMKKKIDTVDFDICLIGAGAYGFHLAAYVKRIGKKSFHLGGSLQLLFGIKGKRWEDPNYNSDYNYSKLINKHWIYPTQDLKPKNAYLVEDACYW